MVITSVLRDLLALYIIFLTLYLETSSLLLLDGSYKISGIFGESPKFLLIPRCYGDGDGDNPHNGDFQGKPPKFRDGDRARLSRSFGETLGTGTITISGILGGEIPENLRTSGWGQR